VSLTGVPGGLGSDELATAYETLRRQVLEASGLEPPGPGLVLLLRRGMGVWMEVCAQWLSRTASGHRLDSTPALPRAERADVVVVLASMVRPRVAGRRP
jgi:hypothetical protein